MEKVVFAVYDMQADFFDAPMVFDDVKIAIGGIRRNVRDMYLKKEITLDALRDRKLVCIATYDSLTGEFGKNDEFMNISVRMSDFVGDLVINDGDEV